jgi:N5-methyltetrahydromethanopterin:coenzyme M methyltransferase subunit H
MEIRNVCGVNMGGLPGETPSLLVGSMFFDRQKIVTDPIKGEFDREAAKALLDLQAHWSETTGNPACVDVIAITPDAMHRYLEFVCQYFDGPIMVDGTDGDVKVAGIEYLAANGQAGRAIYNSISPETAPRELEAIAKCGVKSAVLLAVDPADFTTAGKVALLKREDGLLVTARSCGIENILVDPGVIDLLSVGTVKEVFQQVKKMGCFAGAAPHNAIGTWAGLTTKLGAEFKPSATAVLNALPIAWGGDFVIYGPPTLAPTVFPAVAMVDAILSQPLLEQGQVPDFNHPMFKLA